MRQKYSVEKILNHIRNELLTAYYEINYTIYLVNCKSKSPSNFNKKAKKFAERLNKKYETYLKENYESQL